MSDKARCVPSPPLDLSHLSNDELTVIETVLEKQKQFEKDINTLMRYVSGPLMEERFQDGKTASGSKMSKMF